MPRQPPAVRILPMSDRTPGFRGREIEDVQTRFFLGRLVKGGGRWGYRSSGLVADVGTIVLFQFQACIIASAVFLRDEKFERPRGDDAGEIYFEVRSIRTFKPLNLDAMRKIWPGMNALGHVKQRLNPASFSTFKRRLDNVKRPSGVP